MSFKTPIVTIKELALMLRDSDPHDLNINNIGHLILKMAEQIEANNTRRFEAAKAAMQGMQANPDFTDTCEKTVAKWSVDQADALIAELDKVKP